MNYYNEFDPHAAQWLRNLIDAGHIPPGVVDSRSICNVNPTDLMGFTQCHFFAGIGGWALALDLAGWPRDRPVWTGSCPCQPFSTAGRQKGIEDERHLWPVFLKLIAACRPEFVFGEQVASAIGHGWLDLVQADMDRENYACRAAVLPACSVGAPHLRQRLYWVADTSRPRLQGSAADAGGLGEATDSGECQQQSQRHGAAGSMADANGRERNGRSDGKERIADREEAGWEQGDSKPKSSGGEPLWLADSDEQRRDRDGGDGHQSGRIDPESPRSAAASSWSSVVWHPCRDGKSRPVPAESALLGVVDGLPGELVRVCADSFPLTQKKSKNRVGRLKGYGNAIVPLVAAKFIKASQ